VQLQARLRVRCTSLASYPESRALQAHIRKMHEFPRIRSGIWRKFPRIYPSSREYGIRRDTRLLCGRQAARARLYSRSALSDPGNKASKSPATRTFRADTSLRHMRVSRCRDGERRNTRLLYCVISGEWHRAHGAATINLFTRASARIRNRTLRYGWLSYAFFNSVFRAASKENY